MTKKILFILLVAFTITGLTLKLLPLLGPSNNAVDIAQAQAAIEAARAAQDAAEAAQISAKGLSDVARGQTVILLLLTLQFVLLVSGLAWLWLSRQAQAPKALSASPTPALPANRSTPVLPELSELIQLEQLHFLTQLRQAQTTHTPHLDVDEEWM